MTEDFYVFLVLLLFGARRVGKTILMRQIVDSFTGKTLVLNGEDIDTQTLLEKASVSHYRHLFEGVELLAIDEAQHIPQIGSKLKLIVDEFPGIRVIATGSSSFNFQSEAGEPLVGRSSQFLLTPFSQQELSAGETPIETYRKLEERLIYGSYPDVTLFDTYAQKREYLQVSRHYYPSISMPSIYSYKRGKIYHLFCIFFAFLFLFQHYLLLFRLLQSRQSIWQLEAIVRPPSTQGVIWSASMASISNGLPQIAHLPP